MQVYTASVVGAGMGGKLSIRGLVNSDRYQLRAIADWNVAARREAEGLAGEIQTFAGHQEMFARCPTDVVCVSTWPPSHLEVALAALEMPLKGILIEKPLGDRFEIGRQVLSAVQAKGIPVVVPHGLLVADHARQIIDRVRQGEIGRLEVIEIQCRGWDIINAGIHWLNFCLVLTDMEPMVSVLAGCDARTRTYRDGMQVETVAVTYIEGQSGLRIVMQTGDEVEIGVPGKDTLFRLFGTEGRIDFYGWEPRYRLWNATHPTGSLLEVLPGPGSAHQRHLENLARLIDCGELDDRLPQSSLRALELCEAAYLSCRHHCQVPLPLETFVAPGPIDWSPGEPYAGQGGGRDGRKLPPR